MVLYEAPPPVIPEEAMKYKDLFAVADKIAFHRGPKHMMSRKPNMIECIKLRSDILAALVSERERHEVAQVRTPDTKSDKG